MKHHAKTDEVTDADVAAAIQSIQRQMHNLNEEQDFAIEVFPFTLSFYTEKMLLLIRVQQGEKINHKLFLVDAIIDGSPKVAVLTAQKKDIFTLKAEFSRLRRINTQLRFDHKLVIKELKFKIKELTSKIKKMTKFRNGMKLVS